MSSSILEKNNEDENTNFCVKKIREIVTKYKIDTFYEENRLGGDKNYKK